MQHPLTYGFNCTKGWDPGLGTRTAFPQAAHNVLCAFLLLSRKYMQYKLYSGVWIIEKSTDFMKQRT